MKLIQLHPLAFSLWIAVWILASIAVWNDPTFDSVGLVLLAILPTIYMEPLEKRKPKGFIVSILWILAFVGIIYLFSKFLPWEELREKGWFSAGFCILFFLGQCRLLWKWNRRYLEGADSSPKPFTKLKKNSSNQSAHTTPASAPR